LSTVDACSERKRTAHESRSLWVLLAPLNLMRAGARLEVITLVHVTAC